MRGKASRPATVALHAGTLNWSYTLGVGLMDVWAVGGHAMLYGGPPDPAIWSRLIAEHGVNVFTAVPTVYRQLLKYGAPEETDLSSLRHCLCAAEPLLPALADEWAAKVGDGDVRGARHDRGQHLHLLGSRDARAARLARAAAARAAAS